MKFFARTCAGAITYFLLAGFGSSVLAATPSVSLSPKSISFGSLAAGTSGSPSTVTLENTGFTTLKITSIAATGAFTQTNNCAASLSAFSRCQIRVTFSPPSTGAFSGEITIGDNASGTPQLVALSGTGILGLTVSATSLSFGNQLINTASAARTITLTNTNSIALAVNSIALNGDFSQINTCGTSIPADTNCTISITFTPVALGSLSGTVTVTDAATSSPQTIKLSGTGAVTGLTSIAVTPQNSSIVPGAKQQFTATGTFSSSPSQNLTNFVTWSSSATNMATISNAAGSQGLANAVANGSATIKATLNSISGSTSLSVAAAVTPALTLVSPNTGQQGQLGESVSITGQNTHFVQGTTTATFGAGITVASLTVNSNTSATAVLNIASTATPGSSNVVITTGSEVATLSNAFAVTAVTPLLTLVNPNTGQQGQQGESVAITGQNTHFVQGTTVATFGAGITVASLTVNSNTSVTAVLNIASTATPGSSNVVMTTGSEVATLSNAFAVTAVTPLLTLVNPNTGQQGQQGETVAITGQNTHFVQGTTTASFGAGITVASLTVNSSASATAVLNIGSTATTGSSNVVMTTGSEVATLSKGFTVTAGTPVLTVANPNTGQQGQLNESVTITGQYTHFVQGTTTAAFGTGITVASLTVNSNTSASAVLSISSTAALGSSNAVMTTGTEVATLTNGFTVTVGVPALALVNPNTGQLGLQGESVTITGQNTHFVQGTTTATFGAGITVASLTVNSNTSATAVVNIASTATPGSSNVVMTTGSEVATMMNGFSVTAIFTNTGSMNAAREYHTATLLNNGMVLVAGGSNSNGVLNTAELYNPTTGTFTYTGNLNTARYGHTATLMNNGMVLIAGGSSSSGQLASAELYNPATGTFANTGSLSNARGLPTATLLNNGIVLVTGGFGSNGVLASAELYNPATAAFSTTGSLNTARYLDTATLLANGNVLVAGGYGTSDFLDSAEIYNTTSGTFSNTGNLNTAREYYGAALLNTGNVLIPGGYGSNGYFTSVELYNPTTGAFTYTGSLNTARGLEAATVLNSGLILVSGGYNSNGVVGSAEIYNPTTATFTNTGSLNTPRYFHTATLLNNGMVLIVGGYGADGVLASAELY